MNAWVARHPANAPEWAFFHGLDVLELARIQRRKIKALFWTLWQSVFTIGAMKFSDFTPINDMQISADDLQNVALQIDPHAPDQWTELAEIAYKVLRNCPELEAVPDIGIGLCAIRVVYQFATEIGGEAMYIPMGLKPSIEARNAEMVAAFTGDNIDALARRYRCTPTRVRQVLAADVLRKKGIKVSRGKAK